ncbi:MAG: MucR family transcriptional regulator [Alphaproteobacteria bacterium]|nr:MucR family transcriptional regulator [Alphaproteobacteria bacterium]
MRDENSDTPVGVEDTLRMTSDIVASFVANNKVAAEQLHDLIRTIHKTVANLAAGDDLRAAEKPKPAVPVNKSVHNEYIICLEDGKKLTMLKRYLRSTYGMTPDEYRKRWGLPADYPMVAPAYAAQRSAFAKQIGLGRGVRRKET